jgi:hypothetical protein
MKNVFCICCLFLLANCGDDDKTIEYSPFFSFLEQDHIHIDTVEQAGSTWEYGFKFKSLKTQMITRVGILLPALGTYEVKLYDLSLNTVLLDTVVTSIEKFKESFIPVPEINIRENGVFGLTIKADAFIKVNDDRQNALTFPTTKGLIEIISFNEGDCDLAPCNGFPLMTNAFVIAPCVNVTFVSTE